MNNKLVNEKSLSILRAMVSTDFKVRYQSSMLGYLWSLLKPLFLFGILFVLFSYVMPGMSKDIPHFGVWLLLGIVMWNFFSETTMVGASSIVSNGDLIRKIDIPRYLLVVASSVSALINLGLGLVVVFIFALVNGVYPTLNWLLLIPVVLELFIFAIGLAFLLSALYVRFRDITYIWEIVLQAGFYSSMIIFPIINMSESLQKILIMNPITQIIQDARYAVMPDGRASVNIWHMFNNPLYMVAPVVVVFGLFLVGVWYFNRRSKYFAEDI